MIISSVLQTILHVIDDGMSIQEALDAPRIHHQWLPDELVYERRALAPDVTAGLRGRGHKLSEHGPIAEVEPIGLDAAGRYTGASDPRAEAVALGY
jgi:gamma-glutamyltranspeptidase/glutathione hydrolase